MLRSGRRGRMPSGETSVLSRLAPSDMYSMCPRWFTILCTCTGVDWWIVLYSSSFLLFYPAMASLGLTFLQILVSISRAVNFDMI